LNLNSAINKFFTTVNKLKSIIKICKNIEANSKEIKPQEMKVTEGRKAGVRAALFHYFLN
jgi:hypothetical protein